MSPGTPPASLPAAEASALDPDLEHLSGEGVFDEIIATFVELHRAQLVVEEKTAQLRSLEEEQLKRARRADRIEYRRRRLTERDAWADILRNMDLEPTSVPFPFTD